MAQLLDGKTLAQTIRAKVKARIQELRIHPGLAVILVGDNPASRLYVELKQKACEEVGIGFEKFLYPADISEETLMAKIRELNTRKEIHGILVQLPLPSQNADRIISAIDPKKDADGFHRSNMQNLKEGKPGLVPAVALGIMKLLESAGETKAKTAVVVGSELFAEPLVYLLRDKGITAEIVSPEDPSISEKTKNSDILIVAAGKPELIKGNMIKTRPSFFGIFQKPLAVVIDVGTTKVNGKIKGDVEFSSVSRAAKWLSPVPCGVGPMTVAMLLVNVVKACKLAEKPTKH